ncbi:ATP-dependent Clp protease ATP-binding subunit ClpX [Haliangium ochraceum]|uniref:ATP-dependent Clp protease ATP-binding subunit ClpX n=1 Tax=Haliangium ochraceum (strain DSM 14365 / JCM 11303 / SMP-2) TaxID=502025 RepID=D0LUI3_HALO1|nr:ATP-dependent Clp protease ATP-binding subunit ClpX [Haliangium ochraceum]ACY19306.1 ATP-dependent Clp protease, ATP-binding subunit ClpX [Haliangium ochraceum DSM 14365]
MEEFHCSFCGKQRREVRKLISGPRVFICDECVKLCNDILAKEEAAERPQYPSPHEIVGELDRYVVGQGRAKRALSVAVYNHYKRIGMRGKSADVELQKGNILLIGPTGCGKTLLAQTLAKKLDVPFAIADATTLTEAGYVGEDVESVIKALFRAAGGDVEKTARGILCIDEIDKIARKGGSPSPTRDVSGEGVQQALLKILEGKTATITPDGARNRPQQELIQIDTTDILFICTGAFNGLEDIVRRRVGERGLGFGAAIGTAQDDKDALRATARAEDLTKFGMIPEFMGRLPVVVSCDALGVDELSEVLWRPKNALSRQYERLFALEDVKLTFTQDALRAVAEEAHRRRSGARGLRAILEEIMLDVMYEIPSLTGVKECVVNRDVVENRERPELVLENKAAS